MRATRVIIIPVVAMATTAATVIMVTREKAVIQVAATVVMKVVETGDAEAVARIMKV